jgi:predicted GNAT superfamily acetyltransferase
VRRVEALDEYQECMVLQEEIWGPGFRELVPSAILMVAQKMSGVCAGAFSPDGRMLGFVFGISGLRHGALAHWSDMMAVRPEARGARVGEQLKAYQRALCIESGIPTMYWTFDPLVARNAHLNTMRLGAVCAEYVENMYGSNTGSPLHGALETDRWIMRWDLTQPVRTPDGTADPSGVFVVRADATGAPQSPAVLPDAPVVRIAIPPDHEQLSLDARIAWRLATRRAFTHYLSRGGVVTRFERAQAELPPFYEVRTDARLS